MDSSGIIDKMLKFKSQGSQTDMVFSRIIEKEINAEKNHDQMELKKY